jgi:thioesterase domain-containing protein
MKLQVKPDFLPWLKKHIPLTQHMGIHGLEWQDQTLVFNLQLEPLVNDKGTGFGGGVAGLATLLGWCYVNLLLDQATGRCPVVIKESSNRFVAPITGDFEMLCWCDDPKGMESFLERYKSNGRARMSLNVEARQGDQLCFSYEGVYVALGDST